MAHVHEVREPVAVSVGPAVFAARLIHFIFGFIIASLLIRMVLLLLGANQGNAFVDFIYSISGVFAAPFYGIFAYTPSYGASVLEVSSIVAVIVYALVSWGLVSLVTLGTHPRSEV